MKPLILFRQVINHYEDVLVPSRGNTECPNKIDAHNMEELEVSLDVMFKPRTWPGMTIA